MKRCITWPRAARLAVLATFFLLSCSDPAEEVDPPGKDEGENEEEITPEKADAVLEAFSFTSATTILGTPPTVSNTNDIRTSSKDTIYTLPGVKDLLRISHPASSRVKAIYFGVQGSTFYYHAAVDREEKSDTVAVIFFEIDPAKIEEEISSGSTSVPIEIIAYDENDEPLDVIERIMTIEKPTSNGCNILEDTWYWEWSALLDPGGQPYNLNCRGERYPNNFTFTDCCLGSLSCPTYDANQNPIYEVEIPISLHYTIYSEWLQFHSNGGFERQTMEQESYISNPGTNPQTFDPCKWTPSISVRTETVSYYGTHDYVPGNNTLSYIITDDSCDPNDFGCGFGGSLAGAQLYSTCHIMVLSKGTGEQKSVRMFSRGRTGDMEGELMERDKFWD